MIGEESENPSVILNYLVSEKPEIVLSLLLLY